MPDAEQEVLEVAAALVAAFAAHDTEAYFASFAPEATFLFHTTDELLRSRAEYEALWAEWEREAGFRIDSCTSSGQHVQLLGDPAEVAVFTHRVRTTVRTHEGAESLDERETIVFQRRADGRWTAVHEHLSAYPSNTS